MHFSTAILSCLSASVALAAPALSIPRQDTCSFTTELDYYQGTTDGSCGVDVSVGSITSGTCLNIETQGINVFSLPSNNCTLLFFFGSTTCGNGIDATSTTSIPAGDSSTCIATGVEEPPWYTGSALLTCEC